MDLNKLAVLRQIDYRINRTCGMCSHGMFNKSDWGTCNVQMYEHLKHNEETRHLSIHALGSCKEKFQPSEEKTLTLGGFVEFFK